MVFPVHHIVSWQHNDGFYVNIVVLSVIADCLVLLMVVSAVNIQSAVVLNACRVGAEYIRRNWICRIFHLVAIFTYFHYYHYHLIVFVQHRTKTIYWILYASWLHLSSLAQIITWLFNKHVSCCAKLAYCTIHAQSLRGISFVLLYTLQSGNSIAYIRLIHFLITICTFALDFSAELSYTVNGVILCAEE